MSSELECDEMTAAITAISPEATRARNGKPIKRIEAASRGEIGSGKAARAMRGGPLRLLPGC
jgi:hypothetical protein